MSVLMFTEFRAFVISGISYLRSTVTGQRRTSGSAGVHSNFNGLHDEAHDALVGLPASSSDAFLKFDESLKDKNYAREVVLVLT